MEFSDGRGGEPSQDASDNVPRQAKRKMKTPSQIDVLEKAYNVSSKLSEHMRLELAMKTDLSSREISMWFANKRFQRKQTHLLMESNREGEHPLPLQLTPSRGGSGFELAARHFMDSSTNGEWLREKSSKMNLRIPAAPQVKRKNHVQQVMPQIKTSHHTLEPSVVTFVERKLGGRLRDDGPLIGIKFDPLPPGAFGSALCSSNERKQKPEQPTKTTEVESILKQNEGINKASSLFQQMKFSLSKNSTRGLPIGEIGCTVHPDSVHNLSSKFPCFSYGKHHPQKTDLHPDCSLQADAQFTTDPVNVIVDKFVLTDTLASDFSCQVEKLCKSEKVQTSIKVEDLCRLVARRKQCVKRKGKEKTQIYNEIHDLELHNEKEVEILEKHSLEGKLQHANQTDGCKKLLNNRSLENEAMRKPKELRCRVAAMEESASKTFIAHGNIQGNMKLIEDEQLELMKLAASKIGLHSINFLDKDTLDKLHSFKDLLGPFPPESVSMKRPFAVSPWTDSEENVGNLLMVWKFLVTFAGDLGLWPFTLDEFAQAFHDHDSRLLAELHVALLKYIIRDLEDARKICAYGPHICENNASDNPGNLSLNIVYGAHAWGFDMNLWKSRLNFFTWPEILRQVALSAGFGPKLKKNAGFASCHGYKDGNCSDWSESLDKHAGGSNSVIVKEKDKSSSCDSSYPLIPGTLEFAVFQAFFLAGKDGLTPVEIADCIHKYRLCDLRTMESVHASIANILSKDVELFERVGLALFRIKPCFRRDPSVVEKILAGLVDRADDIADSFDEYHLDLTREGLHDFNRNKGSTSLRKSKQIMSADDPVLINESGFENVDQVSLFFLENSEDGIVLSSKSDELSDSIYEASSSCGDMKDKEHISVSWIQELSEGEYFLLSTEERLKVLVTLVNVVAEGNSFHTFIEKRLKEAQIYKKKMMEKMRLNKKLLEESHGHTNDANYAYANASSFTKHALKCSPNFVNSSSSQTKYLWQQFSPSSSCIVPEKFEHTTTLNLSKLKLFIDKQAEMLHSYRFVPLGEDRRHNRYWQFSTSSSRNDPGSGRIFFESSDGFWRVIDSDEALDAILAALDIHGIRESHLYFMLKHVETTFKDTTRRRKSREFYGESTSVSLQKSIFPDYYTADHNNGSTTVLPTFDSLQSSPSLKIDLVNDDEEKSSASKKYLHYMKWMWQECFNAEVLHAMRYGTKRCLQLLETCHICYQSCLADEKHCTSCHVTFSISNSSFEHFSEHSARCKADSKIPISVPLLLINIQLLKAQLAIIEASIPMEAFHPFWDDSYRKSWGIKLKHSSSAREILQNLTLLENAIKPECLCPDFITTNQVLNSEVDLLGAKAIASKPISIIPWIPETTAAVALRLLDLDASIPYMLKHGLENLDGSEAGDDFLVLPRSIAVATGGGGNGGNSNMESFGTSENSDKIENSCESSDSLRAAACSCKMNAGSANTRRETRVFDAGAALCHGEAVESNEYLRWQEAVDSYLDIEDCSNERDIAAFPAKCEDGGENLSSVSTK